MQEITIFNKSNSIHEIREFFHNEKKPFIVRNVIRSKINLDFLNDEFKEEEVISLNPNSDKEILSVGSLIQKVKNGKKYRLRANTKLGNKVCKYIDTSFIKNIKNKKIHLFDYLLSFGKTSRQKTLFMSTKDCTFTKHSHIISGLILHLDGKKTWYISKKRESFFSIKYKSLLNPNPLYVTDKRPNEEISFSLKPGDLLYMPAYWFHYTISHATNISYGYFFTEPIKYYLTKTFVMFAYQALTNPIFSLVKALKEEPEEHIYDRSDIVKKCKKIRNRNERNEALEFFKENDYS